MMLAIADHADDDGRAYPAVATLARKTRMGTRNANYLLTQLQASGELVVKIGGGPRSATNLYRIVLDKLQRLQPSAGVQQGSGVQGVAGVQSGAGVQQGSVTGATPFPPPLQPTAPKPSLNHQEPSMSRPRARTKLPACPYEQIRVLYNEVLPELPAARTMGAGRLKVIKSLWTFALTSEHDDGTRRATDAAEALAWFRRYFERARENDFLMGRTPRGVRHETWQASIDFLCGEKGRVQVLELTKVQA